MGMLLWEGYLSYYEILRRHTITASNCSKLLRARSPTFDIEMSLHATQLPDVNAFHDKLPKHVETPTNKARAFISGLPPPTVLDGSPDCVSSSNIPFREDEEDLSIDNTTDGTCGFIVDGISDELNEHNEYRSRMRMIQCQLYLLRCEVLQSTANFFERKPWAQCPSASTRRYYRKILYCATKAQQLAEAISNRDLQTRSEYWSGRGCGGLCDWGAAMSHLAAAVKLDVPNDMSRNRTHQQRVVLQTKKDDVEFLLQSVTRRYDEWLQNKREAFKVVHGQQASPSPSPVKDIEREALKEPVWTPHYEHMIYQAKQQSATERRFGRLLSQLISGESTSAPFSKEEIAALKKRLTLDDGKREIRKILNVNEWLYILRGDEAVKKRSDSIDSNSGSSQDLLSTHRQSQHSQPSRIPSSASSINSSTRSSLEISHSLGNGLDLADYESGAATLSLFGSTRSPSSDQENDETLPLPATDLQGRRNVKLSSIRTCEIQKDIRLGEAVLGPSILTNSVTEKDPNEAETTGIACDDGIQHTGSEGQFGTPGDEYWQEQD